MILRNPVYTPIYQRYVTAYCLPILYQILVYHRAGMSRLRDTEQEVQCTSNRKLTEQYSHSKLSQPETIPSQDVSFVFLYILAGQIFFSRDPTLTASRIFVYGFWSLFLKVSQWATNSIETFIIETTIFNKALTYHQLKYERK